MKHPARIALAVLATGAVLTTASACQSGDSADKSEGTTKTKTPAMALAAAYTKASAVRSSHIKATVTMPGAGGEMTMTGVLGWSPMVMDVQMSGGALAESLGADGTMHVIMKDHVEYMDMSAMPEAKKELGDKNWMKLDLDALAKQVPDKEASKGMSAGVDSMDDLNQNPSQNIAMLQKSPNVKKVGTEKVNGVQADHYRGTFTLAQALKQQSGSKQLLSADQLKAIGDTAKKSGITDYKIDVWVGKDGLPVSETVVMNTKQGAMKMHYDFTSFDTKPATVDLPPAGETVDMMKMLQDMSQTAQ